jgi:glycosyl transferase family 25
MNTIYYKLEDSKESIPADWDFIDKVVYINLDHRTDRNEHMKRMTKTFGDKVVRFSAISNPNGHMGCLRSHISALQLAESNKWKNVLILEDDAQWNNFEEGYQTLRELISNPYDVIMLGWNYADVENTKLKFNPTTNRVSNTISATGYIVNSTYLKMLVFTLREALHSFMVTGDQDTNSIDRYWNILQERHRWFAISPALLYQIPSQSDTDHVLSNCLKVLNIERKWDFIDKVVYINLDHRTDRNDHMKKMTRTFGNKVSRFSAIKNDKGLLGCVMSHINVLKNAIENNYENILILEDDAEWNDFEQGYPTLKKLASNPYDVIMLGGSFPSYNSETYKVNSAQTTTGYLVNKRYMRTLLSNFEEGLEQLLIEHKHESFALDMYWKRLQKTDNWFIVQPPLIYQLEGFSDIENKIVDYRPVMGIVLNTPPLEPIQRRLIVPFLRRFS